MFRWKTNNIKQLLRYNTKNIAKNWEDYTLLQAPFLCTHRPPSGWQTPEDYSTAGLLEWIVYREHSIGEQKHAKAKKSHVQRAGIFSVHNDPAAPLIYLTPTGFSQRGSSAAPKSSPLPNIYSVVQLSIPNPSSAKCRFFSHGSGVSSWTDSFNWHWLF